MGRDVVDVIVGVDAEELGAGYDDSLLEDIEKLVVTIPLVSSADVFWDVMGEGHYIVVPISEDVDYDRSQDIIGQIITILDNFKDTSPWVEEGEHAAS